MFRPGGRRTLPAHVRVLRIFQAYRGLAHWQRGDFRLRVGGFVIG